jgi:hypothetical protein
VLTTAERVLTPAEVRSLETRLADARVESRNALVKHGGVSVVICGILGLLTFAASNAPGWVIAAFWSVLAITFTLWTGLPWHRTMRHQVASLEDARRASRARVIRIQSSRVVEFEEEEDEGACYAFELDPSTCVFVVGQEFYEDDDFPNSDFSIVELLGTQGRPIDAILEKVGNKLTPERVIPAGVKRLVEIPEHLTTIEAPIEHVEDALGKPMGRGY